MRTTGAKQHQGQEQRGNAGVVGVALLQTERAGRVAAEMLESERGENDGGGSEQHERAQPVGRRVARDRE